MRARFDLQRGGGSPPSGVRAGRASPLRPASPADVLPEIPIDPQRWREVLQALLAQHNWAHGSKPKNVSHKTIQERREFLFRFFKELRQDLEVRYFIDPRSLAGRHVSHAVKLWIARGLSPGTIQNYLSILRVFSGWIGKPGMVETPTAYVMDPTLVKRTYAAQDDRGWSSAGVDLPDTLVRIDYLDVRVGAQLRMCGAFGLRVKESIMCRPHHCEVDGSVLAITEWEYERYLEVKRGTKGGRLRHVPIDSELKRAVLEHARAVVLQQHESLANPTLTLKQAYHRFYNVLRNCGVTRDELGVTAHGLRHEYANDVYERAAGAVAPLRGGPPVSKDVDDEARLKVSHELGHGRKSISSAYLGGLIRQGRLNLTVPTPSPDEE